MIMAAPMLGLVIRHVLTAVGAAGMLSGSEIEALAGGAAVAVGLGWSIWKNYRK